MSKRTDAIKNLFTAPRNGLLSADNIAIAPSPRVSSGAVRSLKNSFSEVERENQTLRDKLAAGGTIVEIDTSLIDPSPVSDRFRDDDTASYELLKQSIAQRGQEVPVLLREHPTSPGRYQSAYGHRRIRAARELGIRVRAILKTLSDEQLVVAQGLENAPREDLSFIERAMFAAHIEDAGHKRSVVQDALAIDRAEASKLIAVANGVPHDIVDAIGKAPKIGRGRWQALADVLGDAAAIKRARLAVSDGFFLQHSTDVRFLTVFKASVRRVDAPKKQRVAAILNSNGQRIAQIQREDRGLKLSIDKKVPAAFTDFLVDQLPHLLETFMRAAGDKEDSAVYPPTPSTQNKEL